MAILPLPQNPFGMLGGFLRAMYLKINEIIAGMTTGGNSLSHIFTAGQILGGQRVVMMAGSGVVYYDPSNELSIGKVVGITDQAAILNDPVNVITDGIVVSAGWGLIPGAVYYADINGMITTTEPAPPFVFQRIGVSVDSDSLKIELSEPISKI